jgi:hypothetical protein
VDGFLTLNPLLFWAQVTAPNPDAFPLLALRRWYGSLSLSSPVPAAGRVPLYLWLGALGLALILAILIQGPGRALRQLLDLPGHGRLLSSSLIRLRGAARSVAILICVVVLAWTVGQFAHYDAPARLEDLIVFVSGRPTPEIALEQGLLAALVPLRDVLGLGDYLILMIVLTVRVFKLAADRWSGFDDPFADIQGPPARGVSLCWIAGWLYIMYRLGSLLAYDRADLPLDLGFFPEVVVVPVLMLLADAMLLAMLLVELRAAGLEDDVSGPVDVRAMVTLWPAAILACAVAIPARYIAAGAWLFAVDLPVWTSSVRGVLSWLMLGWGLATIQAVVLGLVGVVGVVAWSGGRPGELIGGWLRLTRAEGGRVVAWLAGAGLAAGVVTGLAYGLVLSFPREPWLLAAADSYAHYATLMVGLVALSGLVELGSRSLPRAELAATPDDREPAEVEVMASAPVAEES